MKAVGIVAEYNPFHNGHLYQIEKIKELYPDYKIVVVMTGNFTERGDISIIDKYKRCEIALNHGVDLVVELPYPFSTQSADFFAYGAVTLLEKLKIEKIVFGSESDNLDDIKLIAQTQLDNPEFEKLVKIYSKMGENYPTAISKALYDLTEKKIDTPNDLLGVSYVKVILKNNYKIEPITIKRTNNYHEIELDENLSSATSIRKALKSNKSIEGQVPYDTLDYFKDLHFIEDYYDILKYKVLTEEDLSIYQTVDEGIDKLMKKVIIKSNNYNELINNLKSKRYTYNKIQRMLLHILCNFTKEKRNKFTDITYIRILGFNNNGRNYLSSIKKDVDVPIISKITKHKDPMLEYELETTNIYNLKGLSIIKEEDKLIYKGDNYDKE